jgi:hypothetical protein
MYFLESDLVTCQWDRLDFRSPRMAHKCAPCDLARTYQ